MLTSTHLNNGAGEFVVTILVPQQRGFNPSQPRDEAGRFASVNTPGARGPRVGGRGAKGGKHTAQIGLGGEFEKGRVPPKPDVDDSTYEGREVLRDWLMSKEAVKEEPLGESYNSPRKVKFADGTAAVEKEVEDDAEAEVEWLGYEIGRQLGANVPVTAISGTLVRQEFVKGTVAHASGQSKINDALYDMEIATLDCVLAMADRHEGNFLIDAKGKAIAIDNGNTTRTDRTMSARYLTQRARYPFVRQMETVEVPQKLRDKCMEISNNKQYPTGVRARARFVAKFGELISDISSGSQREDYNEVAREFIEEEEANGW